MTPKFPQDTSVEGCLEHWAVQEKNFAEDATPIEKLRFLVGYAVLAPSWHNAQPWIWKEDGDALRLYLYPRCAYPKCDYDERQMLIGCGAALLHLRLSIHHFGYLPKVEYFPEGESSYYLAHIELGQRQKPIAEEELLFQAIPHRHTNRGLFHSREIPDSVLNALRAQAEAEGVWIAFLQNYPEREALLNLIVQGDLEQWSSERYCRDHAHWIRDDKGKAVDGIPATALGFNSVEAHLLPVAMRQPLIRRLIHLGEVQADRDWLLAGGAPVLGVIGTGEEKDSPRGHLAVGEALGRILLQGCAQGISFSFFNSPVELFHFWPQIFQIIRRQGFLHLIFRAGFPLESSGATPRRPPHQVLSS